MRRTVTPTHALAVDWRVTFRDHSRAEFLGILDLFETAILVTASQVGSESQRLPRVALAQSPSDDPAVAVVPVEDGVAVQAFLNDVAVDNGGVSR